MNADNTWKRQRTTKLIIGEGDDAKIITSKGDEIIIDKEDIDKAMKYSWCISKTGYAVANIGGKVIKMHRYLMGLPKGRPIVDHINGNPLDNRRNNLRICSAKENGRNLKKKPSKSGVTGVRLTAHGMWNARIMYDRQEIYLGNFKTKDEAINAREMAERLYFGEFAPCKCRSKITSEEEP